MQKVPRPPERAAQDLLMALLLKAFLRLTLKQATAPELARKKTERTERETQRNQLAQTSQLQRDGNAL